MSDISKQIVELLTQEDWYAEQPQLVLVDEISFQFDAVLKGPDGGAGLVVVASAEPGNFGAIVSRLRAFSNVMLRSGSMRPLAAVLIGDPPDSRWLEELSTVCRVISVSRAATDLAVVRRALLPLLKIEFPLAQTQTARPLELLRAALGKKAETALVRTLLKAAGKSGEAVQNEMQSDIEAAIARHELPLGADA